MVNIEQSLLMTKIENYDSFEYRSLLMKLLTSKPVEITGQIFNLPLRFNKGDWHSTKVAFTNCVFEQIFQLNETDLQSQLTFENCHFNAGLQFYHCKGGYIGRTSNYPDDTLVRLKNCQISNGLNLQQCTFQQGLSINEQSTIDKLFITDSSLSKLLICESLITELLELSKTEYASGVLFDHARISSSLYISALKGNLHFANTTFTQPLLIDKMMSATIYLHESIFKDTTELSDCRVTGSLQLQGSTFEKSLFIHSHGSEPLDEPLIEELRIDGCTFISGLSTERDGAWKGTDVGHLMLRFSGNLKGSLSFNKLNFEKVTLTGINTAGVSFAYCEINELWCHDLVNQGALSLFSVQPMVKGNSLLDISRSVMGKTFLSNVDLQQYKQIKIDRSNLTELVTSAVHWFHPRQLITDGLNDVRPGRSLYNLKIAEAVGVMRYSAQKELYRQLKFAMEKQGDVLNRLRFKKEELSAYRKELSYWPFKREQLGDRLILWLNRSNDFGFNWLKPAALIFLITLIINPILAVSINPNLSFWPDSSNIAGTWHHLSNIWYNVFTLLNPAHKVSDLFGIRNVAQVSFFFYLVDFLDRLVVSYLLFQMIIAFRKYST